MPTPEESFCCREVEKLKKYFIRGYTCITQVEELLQLISEEKILANSYRNLGQVTDKQLQKVRRSMRRDAYRNFTSWTHGSLGPGNRIPEPSCVVNLIRGKYPDPDGNYMGFRKEPDTAEDISNS
ncbi:hypothetical protein XELAEV_18043965mg [Xenopus laevis]|nr:hypothetical protein XELAEV_18043965mg [Xenopus laevis]